MSTEPTLGPRTAAGKALLGVDWQTVEHHAEQILRVENEAREQGAAAERERLRVAVRSWSAEYGMPGDAYDDGRSAALGQVHDILLASPPDEPTDAP